MAQTCTRNTPIGRTFRLAMLSAALAIGVQACDSHPKVVDERASVARAFVPEWYNDTPRGDNGTVVKTSQAVGATPEMAETMATNFARAAMALSIETQVNVMQRNFQEQLSAADDLDLLQRFQNITDTVASHILKGSHVTRREIYAEPSGGYRCFVRMEVDGGEIAANYLEQLKQQDELETRLRSGEAWAELERRVQQLRQQQKKSGKLPSMTDEQLRKSSDGK